MAMEKVYFEEGKIPLVVDPSGRADTFLNYQSIQLVDCKGLFLKTVRRQLSYTRGAV